MDLQQYLADISLKTMSQLHRAIVHLTGGQVLGSAFGMPVVELHTMGRKSGQPRSTMLTAPVTEGDRVVLVASKPNLRGRSLAGSALTCASRVEDLRNVFIKMLRM